jgi:hypothetical protein
VPVGDGRDFPFLDGESSSFLTTGEDKMAASANTPRGFKKWKSTLYGGSDFDLGDQCYDLYFLRFFSIFGEKKWRFS